MFASSFVYLNTIRQRSVRMFLTIAKIMLPVMVIVYISDLLGLVKYASDFMQPSMALLGLPPEASIIWATTILTNIYGGMASMAALNDLQMTVAQVSALGAMMLFAHNVPTEQTIVQKSGASALFTGSLRFLFGVVYAVATTKICAYMDWLQQPVSFAWMHNDANLNQGPPDLITWVLTTTQSLLMVFIVIVALVVLLDVMERTGLTKIFTKLLMPVLHISGLEEKAAPLTTLGMLLGLAYGGALIIDAAKREKYSKRTLLLAMTWLSLCHSLIEDTALILAIGADIWVILIIRAIVVLAFMAVLSQMTKPHTRWGRKLASS